MLCLPWGVRRGYCSVAQEAGVPVVVLYTSNISLAYTSLAITQPLSFFLYRATRWDNNEHCYSIPG